MFEGDYPPVVNGEFIHSTNNVLSKENRKASFILFLLAVDSPDADQSLSLKEMIDVIHFEIAPLLYRYSKSSYFNEAEYSLKDGDWISRFWDRKVYRKLVFTKLKYDPDTRFACRHCVGNLNGDNLGN